LVQTGLCRCQAVSSALKAALITNPATGMTFNDMSNTIDRSILSVEVLKVIHKQTYNA
jgi:hypothetical protein